MPSLDLLTVWNPSYSSDALDAHLAVLLEWSRKRQRDEAALDDVYVWWGKIRSKNREDDLPHHGDVLALDDQTQTDETHLYLTDYRSVYVAWLGEVTADDVRESSGERDHMPDYYRGHDIDFWFRLFDIRRLVADDTPGTIEELRRLRNTRYHDKPVSLYGGIVELPLIVRRNPRRLWFEDREVLTGGGLWAHRESELRSDAAVMTRELRDNLLGRELWSALEPGTRSFLASAEAVFRARRGDAGFDLSGAAVEYTKAVELEVNRLVFGAAARVLAGAGPDDRMTRIEGKSVDLARHVSHRSVGSLCRLLETSSELRRALRRAFTDPAEQRFLLDELPDALRRLRDLRNPAAHSGSVSADELTPLRDRVLGVGCEGWLGRVMGLSVPQGK